MVQRAFEEKQHLQLSLFDRLALDLNGRNSGDAISDVQIVRNAVLRDVENLLNTRCALQRPPARYKHLNCSVYVYGLDDFAARNPKSPHVQNVLKTTIGQTIATFEPRLKQVGVQFRPEEGYGQNLCFSVQATLHADPIREPICFDTWFSSSRGEYKIDNVK
jgi:type VI secretion system lysozyme-like protein